MNGRLNRWRDRLTGTNASGLDLSLRLLLRLACPLYWLAVSLRNAIFDLGLRRGTRCAVPVISVGNLSVGGTGKSPAVAWVVDWLHRQGLHPVVLSRGYGKLKDGRNDEALELELKLPNVPHLQHWDRVASAQKAILDFRAQAIVLDDGFQHRRLARDLDMVLIDATDSPAAQWLLPAGLRREPMSSLGRAHIVMITRADQVAAPELNLLLHRVKKINSRAVCVCARHRPEGLLVYPDGRLPLGTLQNCKSLAFCGIGNPQAFFGTLKSLGTTIVDHRSWPDHHAYSPQDLDWLESWGRQNPEAKLICTVKDWVKIRRASLGASELWALSIGLEILDATEQLETRLASALISTRNFS